MKRKNFAKTTIATLAAAAASNSSVSAEPTFPISGPVTASVAWHQANENSKAIDIAAGIGTSVYPSDDGTVAFVSATCQDSASWGCGGGFGNYLILKHDSYYSLYAHFLKGSITTPVGVTVAKTQAIGQVGMSGTTTGPHVHFAIGTCQQVWSCSIWPGPDVAGMVVKGAPIPISVGITAANAANGTLLRTPDGRVYLKVSGGALWLSKLPPTSSQPISTTQAAIDALPKIPDGTLIDTYDDQGATRLFRVVGGAVIWLAAMPAVGDRNVAARVHYGTITFSTSIGLLRTRPVDGSVVEATVPSGNRQLIFAGGSVIWLSAPIAGRPPTTKIDLGAIQFSIDAGYLNRYPTNGTRLSAIDSNTDYIIQTGRATVTNRTGAGVPIATQSIELSIQAGYLNR